MFSRALSMLHYDWFVSSQRQKKKRRKRMFSIGTLFLCLLFFKEEQMSVDIFLSYMRLIPVCARQVEIDVFLNNCSSRRSGHIKLNGCLKQIFSKVGNKRNIF